MLDTAFYKGKRILITGHTGFKGAWMCRLLVNAGAQVTGYALKPPTEPSLFEMCHMADRIHSVEGDIRDLHHLKSVFNEVQPEIVIHMAAQPLVRESYVNPVYTYDVNVMGTVNVCECIRLSESVRSFLNVTTDKVYLNREWEWGYRENEVLNGYDPYSNSKSCSELVTSSYNKSFFKKNTIAVSTARAGNVIGGGDFADNRIIPDCLRAAMDGKTIVVRNPFSTRPYQHVLEPIIAYLMICKAQYEDSKYAGSYNVGPDETDCLATGELVGLFCEKWNAVTGDNIKWHSQCDGGPHEANFLKLDCSKIKATLGWKPHWNIDRAMEKIIEWSYEYYNEGDVGTVMDRQIEEFLKEKAGKSDL